MVTARSDDRRRPGLASPPERQNRPVARRFGHAGLRSKIRRLRAKYDYSPEREEKAVEQALVRAELFAADGAVQHQELAALRGREDPSPLGEWLITPFDIG